MKKISIIIPAYNCSRYIEKCLNSIFKQKNADLEVIVVDDGSTDNTSEILKKYEKKILLKSISNSGVANARNVGLKYVTGDFIMFVDADDYLKDNAIETLVMKQEQSNADIVKFRYECVYTDGTTSVPKYQIDTELYFEKKDFKEKVYPMFIDGIRLNSVCLSMYKRSVVEGLQFKTDIVTAEDAIFSVHAFTKAQSVLFLGDVLYSYYQSNSGLTGHGASVRSKYRSNYIFAFETISLLKEWGMDTVGMRIKTLLRPVFLTFDKLKRLKKVSKKSK